MLLRRPYFGGVENKIQIRGIHQIKLNRNLIAFGVYSGASSLFHVISCCFKLKNSWYIYLEEVGTFGRTNHEKKIDLAKYSVIPYPDGNWEADCCLLETNINDLKNICIKVSDYQPQYY